MYAIKLREECHLQSEINDSETIARQISNTIRGLVHFSNLTLDVYSITLVPGRGRLYAQLEIATLQSPYSPRMTLPYNTPGRLDI